MKLNINYNLFGGIFMLLDLNYSEEMTLRTTLISKIAEFKTRQENFFEDDINLYENYLDCIYFYEIEKDILKSIYAKINKEFLK